MALGAIAAFMMIDVHLAYGGVNLPLSFLNSGIFDGWIECRYAQKEQIYRHARCIASGVVVVEIPFRVGKRT